MSKFFNNAANKRAYSSFLPSELNTDEDIKTAESLYRLDRQAKELKPLWDQSQKELIEDIKNNLGFNVVKLNSDPNFKYKELGNVIIDPGAKGVESAVNKVFRKNGKPDEDGRPYSLASIKDHNRLSIQARNLEDLQRLIDYVKNRYNANLEVIDGSREDGYIGFHLTWQNLMELEMKFK